MINLAKKISFDFFKKETPELDSQEKVSSLDKLNELEKGGIKQAKQEKEGSKEIRNAGKKIKQNKAKQNKAKQNKSQKTLDKKNVVNDKESNKEEYIDQIIAILNENRTKKSPLPVDWLRGKKMEIEMMSKRKNIISLIEENERLKEELKQYLQ